MLGVKLEETRVYQEAKQEGQKEGREELKLELVPQFLARGMSMQDVAQLLNLTIEQVRLASEQESSTST
ncbi:aspartate aminotransferase [Nostoc sp.]|uniref:aspartate aminotransferase n=1 Tax=Nostoc sp. TaxID=1180 RepID=UPI002FF824D2